MAEREPLTAEQRQRFKPEGMDQHGVLDCSPAGTFPSGAYTDGRKGFPIIGIDAFPGDGLVWAHVEEDGGACGFTPDQARRYAMGLLAAADHAEYGPGEWAPKDFGTPDHRYEWEPEEPPRG